MHLLLDIFQGLGVAAAVGIRPFLPALLVGVLAAGDIQIDFKGTDYSFLQAWPFLLAMFLAAMAVALLERRFSSEPTLVTAVLGAAGLALGALLFAGALAQDHHATWPGLAAGVLCAGLGLFATRPLLRRVRARLAGADAVALPAYAEAVALAAALLSVVAPGVGVLLVLALAWLLLAGRRREGEKYAGLRILR